MIKFLMGCLFLFIALEIGTIIFGLILGGCGLTICGIKNLWNKLKDGLNE